MKGDIFCLIHRRFLRSTVSIGANMYVNIRVRTASGRSRKGMTISSVRIIGPIPCLIGSRFLLPALVGALFFLDTVLLVTRGARVLVMENKQCDVLTWMRELVFVCRQSRKTSEGQPRYTLIGHCLDPRRHSRKARVWAYPVSNNHIHKTRTFNKRPQAEDEKSYIAYLCGWLTKKPAPQCLSTSKRHTMPCYANN